MEQLPADLALICDPEREHSPSTFHDFLPFELVLTRADVMTLEAGDNEAFFHVTLGFVAARTSEEKCTGKVMLPSRRIPATTDELIIRMFNLT